MKRQMKIAVFAALSLMMSAKAAADPTIAVWLDGNTDPTGGGNPILSSLTHSFGAGSYQLVTTANLETAGFLNNFSTIVVSRYSSGFGSGLSATAAANVKAYVGSGATQGGVALFTNDAADNLYGAPVDPYDNNLNQLFVNAVTFAVASGHGYIGEFNGAEMAVESNSGGLEALGLLQGSASAVGGYGPQFVYGVGPIGAGNPIDSGVTFPFTDSDSTTFLTRITGADPNNIVDVYVSNDAINGLPAVLANKYVITGGNPSVPEPASWAMMVAGFGAIGGAMRGRRRTSIFFT
jgi:hypothetical protein